VRIEALTVPGGEGDRPARLYRPSRPLPDVPILVFAHMGGGVIGDLDTTEAFCGRLAETLRGPVLSVDYRLAPEHRFPAGYEDVLAAFRWARDKAGALGAPPGRAAIGGDSMGGLFAAALAQEMRRIGEPGPDLQLLVYPCVDLASETPSMTAFADAFPLDRATMDWFVGHYLPPGADPADPRNAPGRTGDLSGLAPAVIATAGFDPLVDQGEAYARRLAAAGVPFWVAPGTSGWTSVSGRWSVMTANVAAAADAAVALGAQGLLVTSWLALPPVSDWPGFVWAAGLAWNPSRPPVLAEALDLLADGTAGLGQAWQLLGEVHDLVQPQPPEAGAVSEMFRTSGNAGVGLALGGMTQDMLDRVDESLAVAGRLLDAATPTSPAAALFVDELRWVADALRWGASATRWRLGWPGAPSGPLPLLEELDRLTAEESRLWHLRHRPAGHEQMASELARIREDVAHGDDHA